MSWMNDWFGAMMAASDTRKLRKELRNIDRATRYSIPAWASI